MDLEEIKKRISATLKPQRYLHSVYVAETAKDLAEKYGADVDKAYLAGILHDCAKHYSPDELFVLIDKYSIPIDDICLKMPAILHCFVGAYEAKTIYGVSDEEVLDAILRHTIGGADMSILSEIIYLADGIEPLRNSDGVDNIRKTSNENLHKAVVMYTDSTVEYVIKRGLLLHPSAVETRNFYLGKVLRPNNWIDE